jgi:hypothetical protein
LSTECLAPAAFLASWVQMRPRLLQYAVALGRPVLLKRQDQAAASAVGALGRVGVILNDALEVTSTEGALAGNGASPYALDAAPNVLTQHGRDFDQPDRGLLSKLSRVLEANRVVLLHAQADNTQRRALLSASGAMAGQCWTHVPTSRGEAFENLRFSRALRQRMHIHSIASGQRCQLRRAEKSGEIA